MQTIINNLRAFCLESFNLFAAKLGTKCGIFCSLLSSNLTGNLC
jgi:hypothetical protein